MNKQILEEVSTAVEAPVVTETVVKEELPIDFFASFISKSWDEIGTLKATIEAVSKDFVNTEKVTEILQNLADAYLICVGQLELLLHKNEYLDAPTKVIEEPKVEEPKEEKVDIQIEEPIIYDEPAFTEDLEVKKEKTGSEPFEYFCDFDDIELD